MKRRFNTAGPCRSEYHYMLPPVGRLPETRGLVDAHSYFVIHAPRQSGKTTLTQTLARELNADGAWCAVSLSVEVARPFDDVDTAHRAILGAWTNAARAQLPVELWPPPWPTSLTGVRIQDALATWAEACPKPLVTFIDEVDSLRPAVLESFLAQLRDAFSWRPSLAPASLALVGMRDVRDYVLAAGGAGRKGSRSPFNVSSGSYTIRNFTGDEVAALYAQHTEATGQAFEVAAVDAAHALTDGQPWLVNALARECVDRLVPNRSMAIGLEHIEVASNALVLRQDTHLDSLLARLEEPGLRRVIEPIMAGARLEHVSREEVRSAIELGLAKSVNGSLELANAIYREVVPRALGSLVEASMGSIAPTWLRADGRLDEDRLLMSFLDFWRQHGEPLMRSAPYHEVAPHLVLMAYLHRVVNGGGRIHREFAAGSGRIDLWLEHGDLRLAIELKVWRDGLSGTAAIAHDESGVRGDGGSVRIVSRPRGCRESPPDSVGAVCIDMPDRHRGNGRDIGGRVGRPSPAHRRPSRYGPVGDRRAAGFRSPRRSRGVSTVRDLLWLAQSDRDPMPRRRDTAAVFVGRV